MNKNLRIMNAGLQAARDYSEALAPGTVLQTLLLVGEYDGHGGIGYADIALKTGLTETTVSRNIHLLGMYGKKTMEGLKLVETRKDPENARLLRVHLTTKGRRVLKELAEKLEGTL